MTNAGQVSCNTRPEACQAVLLQALQFLKLPKQLQIEQEYGKYY